MTASQEDGDFSQPSNTSAQQSFIRMKRESRTKRSGEGAVDVLSLPGVKGEGDDGKTDSLASSPGLGASSLFKQKFAHL